MKNKLLTFELDKDGEMLEIHGNKEGLKSLISILLKATETGDHSHMMTASWGGEELTDEKQCDENKLINHVKIFNWSK